MFGKKKTDPTKKCDKRVERVLTDERRKTNAEIKELVQNQGLELKQKDFDLKHFKDEEVVSLRESLATAELKIAVLEKENKMLDKITDLNKDVIDVKEVMNKLIAKLPQVDLKSLTVQSNGNQS